MKACKLELVPHSGEGFQLTQTEVVKASEQRKQINWALYPELYQAKLRRLNRRIRLIATESRERFQLQDLERDV